MIKFDNKISKFHKVSYTQFVDDFCDTFNLSFEDEKVMQECKRVYDAITLPKRSTANSAGYDFVSPVDFDLHPGDVIQIPTGIKSSMEEGWVLKLYPRSNVGFKYQIMIVNTVGIIDGDYIYSDNEGHIFVKIRNDGDKIYSVKAGDRFVQGIFLPFGITVDDNCTIKRNGGIGSTGA